MNTSTLHLDPNEIGHPSGNSSLGECPAPRLRGAPGSYRLLAWLAAAMLLLLGAPAARADRSPADCAGSGLGITLFTSIPDVHIGDTLTYSINVFNGIVGSGRVACDASEIQAFIVTPDGKTNSISLLRTTLHQGESDFYPDVVTYVVRAQDIHPDGTLLATARDVGVIHQNDVNSVGGGFQGVNTQVNEPCVQISALCFGGVGENGAITFSGTVTNCGNNTLVGVTVTNFVNNGAFSVLFPTDLAIGQTATFSGSWIPLNACAPSTAILTVRATDQFTSTPRTVTNLTTITCQNTVAAGIQVTKLCPLGPVAPGQLLTFSGSVSNTGNITLTNLVVVNSQPVANTQVFSLPSLAPGAVANFTGSYLAPTNCSVADTLTARAASVCGVPVSSSASATCPIVTTPQILVLATCAATPIVPGGSFFYNGTVQNTGNNTLTNVVILSDRPAPNTTVLTIATLAPGVVTNFTATYAVPANACSITTTFSSIGKDLCTLTAVTNSATATCVVTTAPAIAVTLVCPATPAATGGLITYSGTVRNTGNVLLNNVVVVNSLPAANTVVMTLVNLAPGASTNFNTTFSAPLDSCSLTSTVTASGSDNCTSALVSNSASATCPLVTTPRLTVTQNCPVSPVSLGGLLTYSGSVSNAGNVTLTNVLVLNDHSGATPVFAAATLAPGAVAAFTGSYTAPVTGSCSITSTLTASASDKCTGTKVTASASSSCPLVTAPEIEVVLLCPAVPPQPSGILNYTGTVSNPGNVTLTNVVVMNINGWTGTNVVVFTAASLAPGATATFSGAYQVPPNCCSVSTEVLATGKDACTGLAVDDTDTITCPVATTPKLVVTKVCPATTLNPLQPGDLLKYTGSVSNAGNITITNVVVINSQSPSVPALGPITLAPGESVRYSASYIVPVDFCGTDTVTATGANVCTSALVSASATTTCPILTTPNITVQKNCPLLPTPRGGLFTFTGFVSNPGNVTLTNIYVVNSQPTNNTPIIGPITLAPGATTNFSASYIAPLCCCETLDTLTAHGQDACAGTVVVATSSAICPLLTTPRITVTRVCPANAVPVGGLFAFTGAVTNIGDITLTNVFVFSNQGGVNTPVLGPIELAPGESEEFSGSYVVVAGASPTLDTVTASGSDTCLSRSVSAKANCAGIVAQTLAPLVASVSTFNGKVTITWAATAGTSYSLQYKVNTKDANWTTLSGNVTINGSVGSATDSMGSDPQRFYRVMILQ